MARHIRSSFAMEVFDQSASQLRRLEDFLDIYLKHFSPKHRTETNQFIHYQRNPLTGRRLIYFGLTYRGEPCGFCVLMFYPASSIGVFDFIVISPTARGHGAYFAFADLIAEYLEQKRIIADYFIAEIIADDGVADPLTGPQAIGRLVRLQGFKRARIAYYAPDPSIVRGLADCRAALMIASNNERKTIPASELLRVFDLIYFNHYLLWYGPFLSEEERMRYEAALTEERARFDQRAKAHDPIILNGMKDAEVRLEPRSERHHAVLIVLGVLCAAVGVATVILPGIATGWVAIGLAAIAVGAVAISRRLRRLILKLSGQL
jgi:hypothetical protein